MLQKFLDFALAAFGKSVSYDVFAFVVIPVGVLCLFALVIRMFRRVY